MYWQFGIKSYYVEAIINLKFYYVIHFIHREYIVI